MQPHWEAPVTLQHAQERCYFEGSLGHAERDFVFSGSMECFISGFIFVEFKQTVPISWSLHFSVKV